MSLFMLLSNASIRDIEGVEYGPVVGIHYIGGRLTITIPSAHEEEPDDDARQPAPKPLEFTKFKAAAAGKDE
jgi:hypothetical protein